MIAGWLHLILVQLQLIRSCCTILVANNPGKEKGGKSRFERLVLQVATHSGLGAWFPVAGSSSFFPSPRAAGCCASRRCALADPRPGGGASGLGRLPASYT